MIIKMAERISPHTQDDDKSTIEANKIDADEEVEDSCNDSSISDLTLANSEENNISNTPNQEPETNNVEESQVGRISNFTFVKKSSIRKHGKRQRPLSHLTILQDFDAFKRQNILEESDHGNLENEDGESSMVNHDVSLSSEFTNTTISGLELESSIESCSSVGSSVDLLDIDTAEVGRCIECVKAIPVFSPNEIEEGDHITFAGVIYDHHAIVVRKLPDGKFEIIEATNTFSGVVVSFSKFLGQKARIVISTKDFDFSKTKIHVIFYRHRRYNKPETVQRAMQFLQTSSFDETTSSEGHYKYNLFENNCEHFATYCVTGQNFSVQVTKFRLTSRLFLSRGFLGISDEKLRNEKEYEHGIICWQCFDINKILLDVPVRPIKSYEDIEKGDVIRYLYYNLWHEAIVMEIKEVKQDSVRCDIAHYAFNGIFHHRSIKQEELVIYFNGKFSKLEYEPPKYYIYEQNTVVERAKSRLDEKMFVFFSNDSSHFARWCKLKPELQ